MAPDGGHCGWGLCGVMLIVQPGTEGVQRVWSIYALIVGLPCVTARDLITRRIVAGCALDDRYTDVHGSGSHGGLWHRLPVPAAGWNGQPMRERELLILGGAAFFILGGYYFARSR